MASLPPGCAIWWKGRCSPLFWGVPIAPIMLGLITKPERQGTRNSTCFEIYCYWIAPSNATSPRSTVERNGASLGKTPLSVLYTLGLGGPVVTIAMRGVGYRLLFRLLLFSVYTFPPHHQSDAETSLFTANRPFPNATGQRCSNDGQVKMLAPLDDPPTPRPRGRDAGEPTDVAPPDAEKRVRDDLEDDAAVGVKQDDTMTEDRDRRSFRAGFDPVSQQSFFAAIDIGVLHAKIDASEGSDDGTRRPEYATGTVITHDGEEVGEIISKLGEGGMGSVFELRLTNGTLVAAKAARANLSAAERSKLEKALVREVAIGFSAGRGPQIASVIRVLIPLPDIESTTTGLLVLCDLCGGGDLEEAMHSGKKKGNGVLVEDYAGTLYENEDRNPTRGEGGGGESIVQDTTRGGRGGVNCSRLRASPCRF